MNRNHNHHHNNKSKGGGGGKGGGGNNNHSSNSTIVINPIANIDVEGTLRASIQRHASKKSGGPGKQWFDKLPEYEQAQIKRGINALLYAGCMAAARRTFDTVVRQDMANNNNNNANANAADTTLNNGNKIINPTV